VDIEAQDIAEQVVVVLAGACRITTTPPSPSAA